MPAGEVMVYVTAALSITALVIVIAGSLWEAAIKPILEWRRHRRIEREVYARHIAEQDRDRLGITPCNQIPPAWLRRAWLRKRGGR